MTAHGVGQGAQVIVVTLLCVFPDGAGVHIHHIGPFGLSSDRVAALLQHTPDPFGISLVLLTAVGFYIGGGSGVSFMPVSGNLITKGELVIQLFLRNNGSIGVHKISSIGHYLNYKYYHFS